MPLAPVGFWHDPGEETITLSGTTGSPNITTDVTFSPTDCEAGWAFNVDGTVDRIRTNTNTQFRDGIEWNDGQDSVSGSYWLRATLDADDAPDVGTLNSWLALTSVQSFVWQENRNTNGPTRTSQGTVKIEIATDSGGTNIVATGYYRGVANVDSGA